MITPTQQQENITLTHVPYDRAPIVYLKFSCDIYSGNNPSQAAAELVLENALLSGCDNLSREAFLDALNRIGTSLNIDVSLGSLDITLECHEDSLTQALSLLQKALQAPTFANQELTRIKQLVNNTLHDYQENTKLLARDGLTNTLFDPSDRRYRYEQSLAAQTVTHVKKPQLEALMKRVYANPWTITVAASENGYEQIVKKLTSLKRSVAKRQATPMRSMAREQILTPPRQNLVTHAVPSKQNIDFSIGAQLPVTTAHKDYLALSFALAVLGKVGGFTGRLMSSVREKEGLTYGIYARTEAVNKDEYGFWRIMTFFSPSQAITGLSSTFRELHKWQQKGVTDDEVERFSTILRTQHTLLFDSPKRVVTAVHSYAVQGRSLNALFDLPDRLHELTRSQINDAIYTHLSPEQMVISAAGPVQSIEPELRRFARDQS